MDTYSFETALCSRTVHYFDIYNQGETCSELVNWIDQGFEALLILSSLVRFTETPLEQSWSCTMTSRYLGFFRDLCLQPWSVTELPQQLNRHHRFWPPAVFSVSFFPWGSLRVIQQNSASPLTTHSLSKTSTTLQQCGQGRGWCPLLPLLVTEEPQRLAESWRFLQDKGGTLSRTILSEPARKSDEKWWTPYN